jgi:hypothetical protein
MQNGPKKVAQIPKANDGIRRKAFAGGQSQESSRKKAVAGKSQTPEAVGSVPILACRGFSSDAFLRMSSCDGRP